MTHPGFLVSFLVSLLILPPSSCPAADFMLGIGAHIYGQNAARNSEAIKESGANSLRDDLPWALTETRRNNLAIPAAMDEYLALSAKQAVDAVLILDYGNNLYDGGAKPVSGDALAAFARYAGFSAQKLAGRAKMFEIWNEWDHSKEPRSVESYLELVKAVAPAVKAANKDAVLLAGAATTAAIRRGWVEKLVALGVLNYVDGISIHPYVHCERDKSPEAWLKFVSETSDRLRKANGGKTVPIYVTEMGWPSDSGKCGTSADTVAQYSARALLLVRTLPEVKGLWWYDLKNDGNNIKEREHNFGLLNYDYTPKPAFAAFRDVAPHVINAKTVVLQPSSNGIVSLAITGNAGKKSFALWTENGKSREVSLAIVRDRNAEPSTIKIGAGKSVPIKGGVLNLTLDGTPQIVTGILSYSLR